MIKKKRTGKKIGEKMSKKTVRMSDVPINLPGAIQMLSYTSVTGVNDFKPPCYEEFSDLMKCIQTHRTKALCLQKYGLLLKCFRKYGL